MSARSQAFVRSQKQGLSRSARDWDLLGRCEPYFSIVSTPEFHSRHADAETIERFYESGRLDIASLRAWIAEDLGSPPSGRALDIGCGAGRLALAMAPFSAEVVGYDVSKPLLEIAEHRMRSVGASNVRFVHELPKEKFDWINSYIVFQHIPPNEGMGLLRASLALAAARAIASIHITFWRAAHIAPKNGVVSRLIERLLDARARRRGESVERLIRMHDYDLGAIAKIFVESGFVSLRLRHTDHDGCHGFWIIGQRAE